YERPATTAAQRDDREQAGRTLDARRVPGAQQHNLRDKIMTVTQLADPAVIAANAEVVVVDDVLTTGATVTESVRVLSRIGVLPCAVLVTCAA
ncbi:hypothetical protein ACWDWR_23545, partial [Nocardia sp. NPDC003354]